MKSPGLLAAGVLLLVNFAAAEAKPAYNLLRLDGNYVKWGATTLGRGAVITYQLAAGRLRFNLATNCQEIEPLEIALERSNIDAEHAMAEIRQAFAAWEAVADVRFRPATKNEVPNIVIGSQAIPRGRAFTNVAYVNGDVPTSGTDRGLTSLKPGESATAKKKGPGSRVHAIAQSLICLNPQERWKTGFDADLDAYDLRYTLIHEIGHSIGLDHAGPSGQVMSFKYLEQFRMPQGGDVAGAIQLYGPARKN